MRLSNQPTNNVIEIFFNNWISFNLLFRFNSKFTPEIEDLKYYVENTFSEENTQKLIKNHTNLIDILKNENLTNRNDTENS